MICFKNRTNLTSDGDSVGLENVGRIDGDSVGSAVTGDSIGDFEGSAIGD